MVDWKEHLKRAVSLKGSQNRLAEAMGCSQSKVSWLLKSADTISGDDAVAVEQATSGGVSRHDLRPDLFGAPQVEAAQ